MTESHIAQGPGPTGTAVYGADVIGPAPFDTGFPVPRLGAGLQLLGEYKGSGTTEPRYIVRRGDGQVVQLSRLLYLVARAIDGRRDTEAISHRVSGRFGREVSAENVHYLIENKLQPLGVTVPFGQEDDQVTGPTADLLLVLKGHRVIFRERQVARIARSLAWLHRPLVVALVLATAVAMEIWLFALHGAMTPVLQVLEQPVLMLVVFALTVASLVFHEFGHASACRYGGARPGAIGCGIFLIWPSMYTDVTDVYRIGRGGRMRTDLGGVYFNVVFILALAGGYFVTGQSFFLAAIYLAHFEIIEQLMPAVRLDGYYILGDLAGVPDLFGKIKPILRSMLPGRPVPPEVSDLKRSARIIVTVWVLTMVPLLLAELGYVLWNLPRLLETSLRSLVEQLTGTGSAFADGQFAAGTVGVIGSLMLVFPLAGAAYLSVRLGGRLVRHVVRATEGNLRLRLLIGGATLAGAAALCAAWVGGVTPKPLPPQPPIAPILQPGVPEIRPLRPVAPAPLPSVTTPPVTVAVGEPSATGPSASPSESGSAGASASASGSPSPAKSPSPRPSRSEPEPSSTRTTATAGPSPSENSPTASPSDSATPSEPPLPSFTVSFPAPLPS
ncbi:zinc metalloprotease [Actinacidiphila glaucinigra]|uniref:Putative peptide zinc metalloprotease protein n=1 Tax=Actinacidiphila glaucinigra TaxID=235986 RepID=A0A239P0L1_9ACTN|nr:putative peptide zinc metalloprotease protein [Actinacidiphila glaucinigra]